MAASEKHAPPHRRLFSPALTLAAALGASIALLATPKHATQHFRAAWREALRPGQVALNTILERSQQSLAQIRNADNPSSEPAKQLAQLREEIQRLELQLELAQSNRGVATSDGNELESLPPLLKLHTIRARVLGRQAKAYLQNSDLISVGRTSGTVAGSLVIDDTSQAGAPALVDRGRDSAIQSGRLVLAGRRVWGKIAEVGPHTSTVKRITEQGYRELVQLASRNQDGRLHFSARGILVGKGQALARIELVETKEPVTVGDLVFTPPDGIIEEPLLYGRVVRVERKAGSAYWEIWMEPAIPRTSPPAQVAVLGMEVNPSRLAASNNRDSPAETIRP